MTTNEYLPSLLAMWIVIGIVILAVNIIRFIGLESSPPGFYIDEAFCAANAVCIKETGHDFFGASLSLFYKIYDISFHPASFYLGEAFWSSLFGDSIGALRAFVATITVVTIIGLYKLTEQITKDKKQAILVVLLASILPWSFQFSRIAWETTLGPLCLIWALYFIYRPSVKWGAFVTSAFLLAVAAYSYSPMRVQVALMFLLLPGISIKNKIKIGSVFGLFCIPLALRYLDPNFTIRARLLALNSSYSGNPYRDDTIFELFGDFLKQVAWHFSPEFLLFRGDHNLRHSIQSFGELDYLTALSIPFTLIVAFSKKLRDLFTWKSEHSTILKLAIIGIFAGITPAALTWEGVPHANRSLGAWPFFVLLGSVGLKLILNKIPKAAVPIGVLAGLFFSFYGYDYFTQYPKISDEWFDQRIVNMAGRGIFPRDYRPLARAYFLMSDLHLSCDAVRAQFERNPN